MSIQRNYEGWVLVCDICQNEADQVFEFWGDVVDYTAEKDNGWIKKYEGGGWIDICPACQE